MSGLCYICGIPIHKHDLCEVCYSATSEYQFTNESFRNPMHLKKEYLALLENVKKNPDNIFIEYLYELEAMAKVLRYRFYDDDLDRRVKVDILEIRDRFPIKKIEGLAAKSLKQINAGKKGKNVHRFPCDDGHLVQFRPEVVLDNWLFRQLISHAYGKKIYLPSTPDVDFRCGFFLPEPNLYIEYFDNKDIAEQKRRLYKINQLHLVMIDDEQVETLNDFMPKILKPYFPDRAFL